jgi:hypothetical protein
MDARCRTIRTGSLVLLGLSTVLNFFGVFNARAQTQVPGQPVPSSTSQQPLPDLNTLIHQAEAQQRAAWKTLQQYTYRYVSSEQDLDSHGAVKKTTTEEAEILCVTVACFSKVVARDGKPISADELKKENDNIDASIAEIKQRNAQIAAGQTPPKKKNSENLSFAYFLQVGSEMGTFSNIRRVQLNGRDTIAIDYQGNPRAKSHTMLDGIFRNLAGTVWVDEQDHALVRIEGHVFEDYKVGGGLLADVHKGATIEGEWIKVNDEVWLPASFSGRGSARIALFSYHSAIIDERESDYRKFRASSTILPGVAEAPDTEVPGVTQTQP